MDRPPGGSVGNGVVGLGDAGADTDADADADADADTGPGDATAPQGQEQAQTPSLSRRPDGRTAEGRAAPSHVAFRRFPWRVACMDGGPGPGD